MIFSQLREIEGPHLIIIGGANGSGKTTLVGELRRQLEVFGVTPPFINADDIAMDIRDGKIALEEGVAVELQAARLADQELKDRISRREDVLIESVLSSSKYVDPVKDAIQTGYFFTLIYVYTRDPEVNVGRVKTRVSLGGHDVPTNKIRKRYERSIRMVQTEYANLTHFAVFFDNTDEPVCTLAVIGDSITTMGLAQAEGELSLTNVWGRILHAYSIRPK